MSVAARLKKYLEQSDVEYDVMTHPRTYTAQETAAAVHVPGKELAKSVVIKADDRFVLAVLPAPSKVDLEKLRELLRARDIRIADESEFAQQFPECEPGAMPPFGNLYGVDVCVDVSLTNDEDIVFNAGTHVDAIRMKYRDFEKLVQPNVTAFASSQ